MGEVFSVKQVASMLDANEETVRRWVRSGLLKADLSSKKDGFKIKDIDLDVFIAKHPRYKKTEVNGSYVAGYELAFVDKEIAEIEALISKLQSTLEVLKAIRDMLTKEL